MKPGSDLNVTNVVPELLIAARAMKKSLELITPLLAAAGSEQLSALVLVMLLAFLLAIWTRQWLRSRARTRLKMTED